MALNFENIANDIYYIEQIIRRLMLFTILKLEYNNLLINILDTYCASQVFLPKLHIQEEQRKNNTPTLNNRFQQRELFTCLVTVHFSTCHLSWIYSLNRRARVNLICSNTFGGNGSIEYTFDII